MTAPTTWDEAAAEAATSLWLDEGYGGCRAVYSREEALAEVKWCITDAMRGWPHIGTPTEVTANLGVAARMAISYLVKLQLNGDDTGDKDSTFEEVVERIVNLTIQRHHKYGPQNILRGGLAGVVLRLSDKLARLENSTMDFDDEKEIDAWEDIVGYAIIAQMLLTETFELPLWKHVEPEPIGSGIDHGQITALALSPSLEAHRELEQRVTALEGWMKERFPLSYPAIPRSWKTGF